MDLHKAGLGFDRYMAQTEYWSKTAFLKQNEAVWLSVGLEPSENFDACLSPTAIEKARRGSIIDHMVRRRELFWRQFNPQGYSRPTDQCSLLAEHVDQI